MRWSSKVIYWKESSDASKLSSRSLSKFSKINLQKSQQELSANVNLQKSELKLVSVEKIKPNHLNKSFISNYMNTSRINANMSMVQKQQNNKIQKSIQPSSKQAFVTNQNEKGFTLPISKSDQNLLLKNLQFGRQYNDQSIQGYSLFRNENNAQTISSPSNRNSLLNCQNAPLQQRLNSFVSKVNKLGKEFKLLNQQIKNKLHQHTDEAVKMSYIQIEKQFSSFFDLFASKFSKEMEKIAILTSQNKTQEKGRNNQLQLKDRNPQGFYRISSFEPLTTCEQPIQKQMANRRPNSFKNRFKQILGNNSQNFVIKEQIRDENSQNTGNCTEGRKILRKRTSPSPRVNSFLGNESFNNNQANERIADIKYLKVKDRSASKSVRQLQEKIVSIKKMLNSSAHERTNDEQSCKVVIHQN